MAGGFVSADIGILESFVSNSESAITEFKNIKKEFERINSTLLKKWQGEGADAYELESSHILENIGGIEDILNSINEEVLSGIISNYNEMDTQLAEYTNSLMAE
ncbi:MAG: hypothetical protein IJK24_08315 [Oscillospiraceae bacterium]|nr:hypothetical protein [Oscillospiraceae bacterium]